MILPGETSFRGAIEKINDFSDRTHAILERMSKKTRKEVESAEKFMPVNII